MSDEVDAEKDLVHQYRTQLHSALEEMQGERASLGGELRDLRSSLHEQTMRADALESELDLSRGHSGELLGSHVTDSTSPLPPMDPGADLEPTMCLSCQMRDDAAEEREMRNKTLAVDNLAGFLDAAEARLDNQARLLEANVGRAATQAQHIDRLGRQVRGTSRHAHDRLAGWRWLLALASVAQITVRLR